MKLKYIIAPMLVGLGLVVFSSCSDDNGSNPTLHMPESFVLNTPYVAASVLDLENTKDPLVITWSQPDYGGFPAAVTYYVQYALDDQFTSTVDEEGNTVPNYIQEDEPLSVCRDSIDVADINRNLMTLLGASSAADVPALVNVFFRISAQTPSTDVIYSNVVKVQTSPYFQTLVAADPILWYLTGSCIGDGSWGNAVPTGCLPMYLSQNSDYDYATGTGEILWAGYLNSAGFKFRGSPDDNWAVQIGQGDSFGKYKVNDGGSANISVPSDGVYLITLDTKTNTPVITEYSGSAKVFDGIAISGSFNGWGDTALTPATTVCENHDWFINIDLETGAEVKFKQSGSWDFNWGGKLSTLSYGYYGTGVGNGDNLYISEGGNFNIYFNDITGLFRFVRVSN